MSTSVEEFLRDKPARAVRLFEYLLAEAERFGPVTLHPVKTRIAFMVEVRFAAVNRFAEDAIDGHLWLKREPTPAERAKLTRVEVLGKDYVCHFRMRDRTFVDATFHAMLRDAYAIGERRRINERRSPAKKRTTKKEA